MRLKQELSIMRWNEVDVEKTVFKGGETEICCKQCRQKTHYSALKWGCV